MKPHAPQYPLIAYRQPSAMKTYRTSGSQRSSLVPLLVLLPFAVALWCAYWWIVTRSVPLEHDTKTQGWSVRGQYGDMFGGFNALITALGFAGLLYTIELQRRDIRQQTKAIRHQELTTTLTAQLDTLVQIQAMPDERRREAWAAIASAPGGPGADFPIERAIATQIQYLDRLAQGEDVNIIPTYGRRPPEAAMG